MEWKAPEERNAARRHPVSPLRGFRIHFERHFLGLAPLSYYTSIFGGFDSGFFGGFASGPKVFQQRVMS